MGNKQYIFFIPLQGREGASSAIISAISSQTAGSLVRGREPNGLRTMRRYLRTRRLTFVRRGHGGLRSQWPFLIFTARPLQIRPYYRRNNAAASLLSMPGKRELETAETCDL